MHLNCNCIRSHFITSIFDSASTILFSQHLQHTSFGFFEMYGSSFVVFGSFVETATSDASILFVSVMAIGSACFFNLNFPLVRLRSSKSFSEKCFIHIVPCCLLTSRPSLDFHIAAKSGSFGNLFIRENMHKIN